MTLQFDASPDELKLFLEEADEHLQLLEEELVKLEKEKENQDLLQAIFRAAHTLKGSSATLGHARMAELTHGMENILDKVRKGQLAITTEIMDVLLESLDILKVLKEEIETLEENDVDIGVILKSLGEVAEGTPPEESIAEELTVEEQQPIGTAAPAIILDWDENNQITIGLKQGKLAYNILINFDPSSEMLPVRALLTLMALREIGEVIKSVPSAEEIEREECKDVLQIVFVSESDQAQINNILKVLPDIIAIQIGNIDITTESAVSTTSSTETAEIQPPKAADQALKQVQNSTSPVSENSNNKPKDTKITKVGRTVRVDVELLDNLMNLVGELVIDKTRLAQILSALETNFESNELSEDLNRTSIHIGRVTTLLQEEIMKARMIPVESLFNKFPRMVRDLSQKAGKDIEFIMEGQETELDRSIIEEIGDPLIHLLRNAVDHAIELPGERVSKGKNPQGVVKLSARHEENHIIISVKDNGRGINPEKIRASAVKKGLLVEEVARRLSDQEAINLIFTSGFSTAAKISEVSGRGVGMDVVRNNLDKVNGSVEIKTVLGQGTEFIIKLPLTLAIIRALMVSVDKRVYAIPLSSVTETIRIKDAQIKEINKREAIVVRGKVLPLLRLCELFNHHNLIKTKMTDKTFVVVVNLGGQKIGLVVDYLIGEQEVVIKSLGKFIGDVQGVAGATILGDGSVALIVDVPSLMKKLVMIS